MRETLPVECATKARSLLIVLLADFELVNRFVYRVKGFDAMTAEIVGRVFQMLVSVVQGHERVMDFRMTFRRGRLRGGGGRLAVRRGRRRRGGERQREQKERGRENAYNFRLHEMILLVRHDGSDCRN